MFTGLIEEVGRIQGLSSHGEGIRLILEARMAPHLQRGESVAVNGACLTVETFDNNTFTMFASGETLKRTTLGTLQSGAAVNLERALAVGDRLGGHWVQGHVDSTGKILRIREEGRSRVIEFSAPSEAMAFLVEKGSVAIDGISLTVANLSPESFSVWVIPETWSATTLGGKQPGDSVNIECDLIAKYVFRYLETQRGGGSDTARRDALLTDLLQQGNWGSRGSSFPS